MTKLYFYYSSMNAGKSSSLIQSNYNYKEKGLQTMVYIPNCEDDVEKKLDNGEKVEHIKIVSRIGIELKAINIDKKFNIYDDVNSKNISIHYINKITQCKKNNLSVPKQYSTQEFIKENKENAISCVFVDEAQFLTRTQVLQLCRIVDDLDIPVLCYGLRSDYLGQPFEGSMALLTLADKLCEMKSICHCGSKATMNLLKPDIREIDLGEKETNDKNDNKTDEEFVDIDIKDEYMGQVLLGHNKYVSVCRKHFYNK